MTKNSKRLVGLAVAAALAAPVTVYATNGMNMEGYGPVATAMGGASMAYDNGTAAMANNPATLGLMQQGNQLDVAWGFLGPDVSTTVPTTSGGSGNKANSSGNAYNMPAIGWAKNAGQLTYGAGVYAQGGMGTEYSATSDLALGSGQKVRSEVGVARIIFPLSYRVNDKLNIGGSIDWVRANMDLKMAVPTTAFYPTSMGGLVDSSTSSSWQSALSGMGGAGYTWGRFDFSDTSDYGGMAKGDGFAAKLGFTYQVNQALSIGGVYQSETSLSDLKATGATLSAGGSSVAPDTVMHGNIKVRNFQWPTTYGVGLSFVPNDKWMVAADIKQLQWSEVMKNFKMTFSNSMGDLNVVMPQHWKDQTVIQLGGAYKVNPAFTVRAGYNHSNNPVPNDYVNPLFPAIVENHYTAGFGYAFNKASEVNFSATYAPKVTVTGTGSMNKGIKISHSQTNWQLMYSHRF